MVEEYSVHYSKRVRTEIAKLLARATLIGQAREIIGELEQIDQVLRIYPQNGEPLRDLATIGKKLYGYSYGSLYIEYILDEERRKVSVTEPIRPLDRRLR